MKTKALLSVFGCTLWGLASLAQNQFPSNGPVQINNVDAITGF